MSYLKFLSGLMFCCILLPAFAEVTANYYPLYEGYPPKYSGAGYYQLDCLVAKEASVNEHSEPLYFEPDWKSAEKRVGVLIIHGYTSGPLQNIELQKYLYDKGVATYAIRLPGHGTNIDDLKVQNLEDWLKAIPGPLKFLRSRCDEIYIYGVCAGGTLSLLTAADNPYIKGIILQAPFVRSNFGPFYTVTPIIPFADFFNIDLGSVYVNIGMNSRHYCYPYNSLRSNFQLLRATLQARRKLSNIKVPILAIHSRTDNVADPQSEDYIARFSSAPYTKVLWFGDEHTPLIHPNAQIFSEILSFIQNPENAVSHQLDYDAQNTEIIKNDIHKKPFSEAYNFSYTNQNNEEYLLEIPAPNYGERTNFLYSRKGNKRMLGWGFTSDHLNSVINPSLGYKYDLRFLLASQNLNNASIWGSYQMYLEFLWQHILYLKLDYLSELDRYASFGYRFPIFTNVSDDYFLQGEIAQNNYDWQQGINLYLYRTYKVFISREAKNDKVFWGFGL